jgi:S-adenosylmethionine synthetase
VSQYSFTSESVTEGHPDKVCDYIADSILDAFLEKDSTSHVACEVLCKDNQVVVAGEIKSLAQIDVESVVRQAIREIGYTDPAEPFNADGVHITNLLGQQSEQIDRGVAGATDQGAGDQGLMFGFATDQTPELMPLPILLAHRLSHGLAQDRKSGAVAWLRPDGKTQVTVRYENDQPVTVTDVVVSTQHVRTISRKVIENYVNEQLLPRRLGAWHNKGIRVLVNPTGEFALGGPSADCGVTGRKIIVDTYGGFSRHGGGAFSGKDASKVDRSAAYFARFVARQIIAAGLAKKAELQVSYAIGVAKPVSLFIETFGTGNKLEAEKFAQTFDFRPVAIISHLKLVEPIYRQTTNYGHFGKPSLSWEKPAEEL